VERTAVTEPGAVATGCYQALRHRVALDGRKLSLASPRYRSGFRTVSAARFTDFVSDANRSQG